MPVPHRYQAKLMQNQFELDEAVYFVSKYIKRYAVDREDREYAAEVIARSCNKENTADDIFYITTCREMINR